MVPARKWCVLIFIRLTRLATNVSQENLQPKHKHEFQVDNENGTIKWQRKPMINQVEWSVHISITCADRLQILGLMGRR